MNDEPVNDDRAREILLAGPAAILMVILVAVIAVIVTEDAGNSTRVVAIRIDRKVPAPAPTTTTIPLPTTTTTAPIVATTTTQPPLPTESTTTTSTAPSAEPPYVAPPLPPGTSATITSCTWSNGLLRAGGTATNNTGADDSFFVTAVWVSQGVELDEDFDLFDIANGQTVSWSLQTEGDRPTAPFSCSVEVE